MPHPKPLVIMAAINGARRTKSDHRALPMTIEEIATEAKTVHQIGAQALHLHVRDADGRHTLDAGLYREAIAAVRASTGPDLVVQITTEAVGIYAPDQQMAVVRAVQPEAVSVAVSELVPDGQDFAKATKFYAEMYEAGIAVQHILYSPDDVTRFNALQTASVIPGTAPSLLFVLGRYAANQESDPADLAPFIAARAEAGRNDQSSFMVCAFGRSETAALVVAVQQGGHCRIGFENNLLMADGRPAANNAERIDELTAALSKAHRPAANREQTLSVLGRPRN